MKKEIKEFIEDPEVKDFMNFAIPVLAVCAAVLVAGFVMYNTYEPPETEIDPVLFAKFKSAMEAEGLI